MSDLYLILRRRLSDVVDDWVTLGTETMKNARNGKGLSYEATARLLHVGSAKTYERWEKRGQVRGYALDAVADLFELQIERMPPIRVKVPAQSEAEQVEAAEVRQPPRASLSVACPGGLGTPQSCAGIASESNLPSTARQ